VLDFPAVRVGFVTQLLWERYGDFWLRLVRDAGADTVVATREQALAALSDPRVSGVAPLAFRLAVAQAVALAGAGVDALVVPELNGSADEGTDAPRGGGADPWIADFPDALRTAVAGLPRLVPVPATLEGGVDRTVVTALQHLVHDPHAVRRIWARRRAEARPPRPQAPVWQVAGARTMGLLGQPWVLSDEVAERAAQPGEHLVSQHHIEPASLVREAARLGLPTVTTDAEVLGAARLFGRRGGVAAVRLLVDRAAGADAWLAARVQALLRKPLEVRYLDEVLGDGDAVDMLLRTPVD